MEFVIKDNATGIPQNNLGNAITPAGVSSGNSLNEHGLGMKQAIAALGKLKYLATKTSDEDKARVILNFGFGELETYASEDFGGEHGTEISIEQLKPIVIANPHSISRGLSKYLGARYRSFLKPDNKVFELNLNIRNINTKEVIYNWEIAEVKPIFFHPSTRTNKPVIINYAIEE